MSAAMADAEPEAEDGSEDGGGRATPGQRDSATRTAPLGPEQLRQVLEQVTKAQPSAEPPPPPFVLQDAARRLRDAAQQAALQQGPSAEPQRPPRLLPPQVRRWEGHGETEAWRGPRPRGWRTGARVPAPPLRPRSWPAGEAASAPACHRSCVCSSSSAPRPACGAPGRVALRLSQRCSGSLRAAWLLSQAFVINPAFAEHSLCSKPCSRCSLEHSEGHEGGSGSDKGAALE